MQVKGLYRLICCFSPSFSTVAGACVWGFEVIPASVVEPVAQVSGLAF